jgi:hypothetical protein
MAQRSRPYWSRTGTTSTTPAVVALPDDWREIKLWVDVASLARTGSSYTAPAVAAVDAITTLSSQGTPTGGTFTLRVHPTYGDVLTTTALTFDESAADVKSALVATGAFATGDITAAGGALPTAITLTWTGVYAGSAPHITPVSAVTGGGNSTVLAKVTTAPAGNGGYGYLEATSQEVWTSNLTGGDGQFLYIATVTSTGNYRVSCYR